MTLVNSDTGVKICESDDFGYGGLAMAVSDLDADPTTDEVVFSPLHDQVNHVSQPARPTLRVLRVVASGSGHAFAPVASLPLSGPQDIAPSCVCGLAVADFGTGTARKVYIVVTTLNGELLVYAWDPVNAQFGALVHSQIVEGSLGAYNSILIHDLSTTNGAKPELYIAGSRGMRRWDFL